MKEELFLSSKVLIVDDEVIITETIYDYLKEIGIGNVKMVHDKESALQMVHLWNPDLVLLDIRIEKGEEGLSIGKILSTEFKIPFIYITAHSDLVTVQKIISTNPNGYLTKPISKAQFYVAVQSILINQENNIKLTIPTTKNEELVLMEKDILFFQASGNYWEVITSKGKILLRKTFEELKSEFSTNKFVRIHRSYIVNVTSISKLHVGKVILENGQTLPVSRSYQEKIKSLKMLLE